MAKTVTIDGKRFPIGTKVLVIGQTDPKLNGVRKVIRKIRIAKVVAKKAVKKQGAG